jgi:SAM-dependent methyltransferase
MTRPEAAVDLAVFDALHASIWQRLKDAYATDPQFPWLDYMNGQVVSHRRRLATTLGWIDGLTGSVLDVGANLVFSCMCAERHDGPIAALNYGPPGATHVLCSGPRELPVHLLDIQSDRFPFADESFDAVLFFEVIEHLATDPMRTMAEINRVTKPDGVLLLSTPNIVSYRSIAQAIAGRHPHLSAQYLPNASTDRHNREYTPDELAELVHASGYDIEWAETPSVYTDESEFAALATLLGETDRFRTLRGDTLVIRGRKRGAVRERHPRFLYF